MIVVGPKSLALMLLSRQDTTTSPRAIESQEKLAAELVKRYGVGPVMFFAKYSHKFTRDGKPAFSFKFFDYVKDDVIKEFRRDEKWRAQVKKAIQRQKEQPEPSPPPEPRPIKIPRNRQLREVSDEEADNVAQAIMARILKGKEDSK